MSKNMACMLYKVLKCAKYMQCKQQSLNKQVIVMFKKVDVVPAAAGSFKDSFHKVRRSIRVTIKAGKAQRSCNGLPMPDSSMRGPWIGRRLHFNAWLGLPKLKDTLTTDAVAAAIIFAAVIPWPGSSPSGEEVHQGQPSGRPGTLGDRGELLPG